MNLAYLSLGALVIAILVSCFTELNVGILSLAFAWIVGVYFGGMTLNQVIAGFPVALFLTLAGVTQHQLRVDAGPGMNDTFALLDAIKAIPDDGLAGR